MSQIIWKNAKIQLCWWHLRKAVREHLAKSKLSTSPYNAKRAKKEFPFIDIAFQPPGRADPEEHEGGVKDTSGGTHDQPPRPHALIVRLPHASQPKAVLQPIRQTGVDQRPDIGALKPPMHTTSHTGKENHEATPPSVPITVAPAHVNDIISDSLHLTIRLPAKAVGRKGGEPEESEGDHNDTRCTFCPKECREPIINMLEQHLCAHPLIPGYAHPSCTGIHKLAVREMYLFCVMHDLHEAWAYLWENWYCPGCWELWAYCIHSKIPVLKTTMILESQ